MAKPNTKIAPASNTATNVPTKVKAPSVVRAHAPTSLVGLPKIGMLSIIASISKNHQGKGNRIKRFGQYKVGQSMLQINQGKNNLSKIEVDYYAAHTGTDQKPLMVLKPCSEASYKAFVAKWRLAKEVGKALPNKA